MEINKITQRIIGCAIEVHKHLGPGLLESAYEEWVAVKLQCYYSKKWHQKIYSITSVDICVLSVELCVPKR